MDTDDSYDEDAATLLGSEADMPLDVDAGLEAVPGVTPTITAPAVSDEPAYSILNILALSGIVCFLLLTGMCMYDLVRHMWSWDQPFAANSQLMEWILGMLGG